MSDTKVRHYIIISHSWEWFKKKKTVNFQYILHLTCFLCSITCPFPAYAV